MPWPNERHRTYITGTPIHPDDLNDYEDATVVGTHGDRTAQVTPASSYGHSSTIETLIDVTNETFEWWLPLRVGDRVKQIRVRCNDTTGGEIACRARTHEDGTTVALGTTAKVSDSSGWQTLALDDIGPVTITETKGIAVQVVVTGGPHQLSYMAVDFDHP